MRVVHYINQFFAGVGGEDMADIRPYAEQTPIGPARLLDRLLGDEGQVVGTVICGDTFFAEHPVEACDMVLDLILRHDPDLVVAGPAFLAGRYGVACVTVAAACEARGLPCVTGMHPDNPSLAGPDRSRVYAVPTTEKGSGMAAALEVMVPLGLRRARRAPLGPPEAEGFLPRGVRRNIMHSTIAAERAVDGLLAKLEGVPFHTEIPVPGYDRVPPSGLSLPLEEVEIALVTEAAVVPAGNPDRLVSARATHWFKYPIAHLDDLRAGEYVTVHGGFDNSDVNDDPDRVLPLDALQALAAEGVISKVADHYYVTTGMATAVREAERIGREIAEDLLKQRVHAALVTST